MLYTPFYFQWNKVSHQPTPTIPFVKWELYYGYVHHRKERDVANSSAPGGV
jgi:hypothetical protein